MFGGRQCNNPKRKKKSNYQAINSPTKLCKNQIRTHKSTRQKSINQSIKNSPSRTVSTTSIKLLPFLSPSFGLGSWRRIRAGANLSLQSPRSCHVGIELFCSMGSFGDAAKKVNLILFFFPVLISKQGTWISIQLDHASAISNWIYFGSNIYFFVCFVWILPDSWNGYVQIQWFQIKPYCCQIKKRSN